MSHDELLQKVINKFWETIPKLWGQIRNKVRTYGIAGLNITPIQFHILRHIRKGVSSVAELAEWQQISRPAISQAVDMMVEKGLVIRKQNPADRRYVKLALTNHGNDLLDSVFSKNRQWMAKRMESLNSDQLNTILEAFSILKNIFDSPED